MNRGFDFFKRTFISGLLFLLPIVILLIVAKKAIEIIAHLLRPVAQVVPADRVVGLAIADVLAIVLLLSIGFATGLIAQTAVGTYLNVRLERAILRKMSSARRATRPSSWRGSTRRGCSPSSSRSTPATAPAC
jgi:uncharacterized membrane protein